MAKVEADRSAKELFKVLGTAGLGQEGKDSPPSLLMRMMVAVRRWRWAARSPPKSCKKERSPTTSEGSL